MQWGTWNQPPWTKERQNMKQTLNWTLNTCCNLNMPTIFKNFLQKPTNVLNPKLWIIYILKHEGTNFYIGELLHTKIPYWTFNFYQSSCTITWQTSMLAEMYNFILFMHEIDTQATSKGHFHDQCNQTYCMLSYTFLLQPLKLLHLSILSLLSNRLSNQHELISQKVAHYEDYMNDIILIRTICIINWSLQNSLLPNKTIRTIFDSNFKHITNFTPRNSLLPNKIKWMIFHNFTQNQLDGHWSLKNSLLTA